MCISRVAQHHMREGHLLTQTQEEMILIGGFGLFWLGTSSPGLILPALPPLAWLSLAVLASARPSGPWRLMVVHTKFGFDPHNPGDQVGACFTDATDGLSSGTFLSFLLVGCVQNAGD